MTGYFSEGVESSAQLNNDQDQHDNVGSPLHWQDQQVLIEHEEALEWELEQDGQQPEASQFWNLKSPKSPFFSQAALPAGVSEIIRF